MLVGTLTAKMLPAYEPATPARAMPRRDLHRLKEPEPVRGGGRLTPARDAELREDVGDVDADRLRTDKACAASIAAA